MAEELSMNEHDNIDEFVIQIGALIGDYYPVSVLRSPAGTGGNGRFPLRDYLMQAPMPAGGTSGTVEATRTVVEDDAPVPRLSRDVGRDLYNAIFTGDIASLFHRSLGRTSAENRRLRIRLHLNVGVESIAPLAALPWELMFRDDSDTYLSMSRETTFVRSLDVPIDFYDLRDVEGPVRVLFVMSNPKGDLNLGAERVAIQEQLVEYLNAEDQPPKLVTEYLENATFAGLEEKLHRSDYHIIHFMGHGDMSPSGEGMLLFHDGLRSGHDLGELMKDEPTTRLVTLNACNTGTASKKTGSDPFAGVASALVMAGVPAVIAMQFPVSDKAAIVFSARLYSQIAVGRSIEASVDSGRRKIKALRPDQTEWATPVLFLRDPAMSAYNASRAARSRSRPAAPTGDVIMPRHLVPPAKADPGPTTVVAAVMVPTPVVQAPAIQTPPPHVDTPVIAAPPPRVVVESAPWYKGTPAKIGVGAIAMLALILWLGSGPDDGTIAADSTALDSSSAAAMTGSASDSLPIGQELLVPATQDLGSTDTTSVATAGSDDDTALESLAGHFETRVWPTRDVKIEVSQMVVADTIGDVDGSTSLTLQAARSVPLDMTFHVQKTPADTCDKSACPTRLYLLMTPARSDRGAACYESTLRQDDGTKEYRWEDRITAPRIPGDYLLVLALSDGEECFASPLLWRSKPLMNLTVR